MFTKVTTSWLAGHFTNIHWRAYIDLSDLLSTKERQVNKSSERSLLPLIILSAIVTSPLIFIAGMIFGSQIQLSNILTADSMSSWVSAIATVSIALLTFVLAKETWYLREAQIQQLNELRRENIRPNVSLAFISNDVSINFKMAVVENLGKGIARNVKFSFNDMDDIKLEADPVVNEFLQIHIFSNGIASLGIGQRIESYVLATHEIKSKLPNNDIFAPEFKILIDFEDVEGNSYQNEIVISFKEFKGISLLGDRAPLQTMAQDLKKLRQQLERMTSSSNKRLHVNTYTSADRIFENARDEREREEWHRIAEEQAAKQKQLGED